MSAVGMAVADEYDRLLALYNRFVSFPVVEFAAVTNAKGRIEPHGIRIALEILHHFIPYSQTFRTVEEVFPIFIGGIVRVFPS